MSQWKSLRGLLAISIVAAALGALWVSLGSPSSLGEARFLNRVASAIKNDTQELSLPELMPGNWELVCDSHGYDGPLYLKQYGRTYPPVAPPQDGVWGLLFISSDGSFVSAVGSCRYPGVQLDANGCTKRSRASLRVQPEYGSSCRRFKVHDG
jgi:hypothetical protein